MRFELADQSQIEAFDEIAIVFFWDILAMNYLEILITDESALSDFTGCGEDCKDFPRELEDRFLPRDQRKGVWVRWICQKIFNRYGIQLSDAGVYFVDLFRQTKIARDPMIQ